MRTKDPAKAEQIRAAALSLLAEEGFDGFAMQKLAKAAGVSPATLYIHFQDRDDLLFQLYREQITRFSDALLDGFDPHAPFAEGLRVQWRNRLAFARANPIAQRFLDQILYSPYQRPFSARVPLAFKPALRTFIEAGLQRGEIYDFGAGTEEARFPFEVFWALAYAPLYELLRLESGNGGPGAAHRPTPFVLTPELFEAAFQRALRSLQP